MSVIGKNFFLLLLLPALLLSQPTYATHISKPILVDSKTTYSRGEEIILNGWADYNAQPTADVLLQLTVAQSDGTILVDESQLTDKQGHFEFKFQTHNFAVGTYQITITSHCQEIHRSICNYNQQTKTIDIQ